MSWDWQFTWSLMPTLLQGAWLTVLATLAGTAIALALGAVFAVAGYSRHRALRGAISFTIQFLRGTPLLVQLYVIFFVLPDIGIVLPAFLAGVIGLGVHYSAYLAEVYRAGIDSVDKGQWDASTAINLSRRQVWLHIILPQAIPKMVPPMGNYSIGMLKESALLSTISVLELVARAQAIGNETYRFTEPLTLVGLLFLTLTLLFTLLLRVTERRAATLR
ncbi:ectoine/hydroxyectoine ABC transporter permease subunit EhuD [Pseudomonas sp. RIT-PI-AD]|uniref:ectoine/hydroxyectoine ABC transporter permease subunit EhuD n=1 Tax=Pseudomonas sp. RIT-PI-AD TaxID=3035294 RepID=UPI0021DB1735|nr:ectoine/hydroxyectoine ABC transporter permease subunit EhuD [Pseudomonas sp. RIT-PI-AD]